MDDAFAIERAGRVRVIILAVYRVAVDARPADWVMASLRDFGTSVLSLVPAGFAEYVRVFHPAYRASASGHVDVTWAEIARANGTQLNPDVQFGSITGSERYEREGQAGVFDQPPHTGSVPRDLLDSLAAVLACHTATPSACYFAIWEGFGGGVLPAAVRSAPTFSVPGRTYHLLTGPVEAVRELPATNGAPSPNLWWPQDHAWCLATEIDLKSTYIGADHRCAQQLVSLPEVEAATVSSDSGIDWLSDTLNPRQEST